jgi:hypothetical protein
MMLLKEWPCKGASIGLAIQPSSFEIGFRQRLSLVLGTGPRNAPAELATLLDVNAGKPRLGPGGVFFNWPGIVFFN